MRAVSVKPQCAMNVANIVQAVIHWYAVNHVCRGVVTNANLDTVINMPNQERNTVTVFVIDATRHQKTPF